MKQLTDTQGTEALANEHSLVRAASRYEKRRRAGDGNGNRDEEKDDDELLSVVHESDSELEQSSYRRARSGSRSGSRSRSSLSQSQRAFSQVSASDTSSSATLSLSASGRKFSLNLAANRRVQRARRRSSGRSFDTDSEQHHKRCEDSYNNVHFASFTVLILVFLLIECVLVFARSD